MNAPLKAGLVGCGSFALRGLLPHLSCSDTEQKIKLVAVADTDVERARAVAEQFSIQQSFPTLEEMLRSSEVDVVLIATPIPFHFENGLAAIEAGKHVYLQKTMTNTLAEADKLLDARDRRGVKVAVSPGFELFPTTAQMRDIVNANTLGRVNVAFSYTLGFGHEAEPLRAGKGVLAEINPAWYYKRGAGPLPDVTVYALHLLTSVLGPVVRVTALGNRTAAERSWRGTSFPVEIDDNVVVTMELASGAIAVATGTNSQSSVRIPWGAIGLYGTEGALEVTDVHLVSGYPVEFDVNTGVTNTYKATLADQTYLQGEHEVLEEPGAFADVMDLADAVLDDRAPRASPEQARHVIEIIERAQAASETGITQTVASVF